MELSDSLLPSEIVLSLNTEIFGRRDIFYFDTTDSTNVIAEQKGYEGMPEGTLVIADNQSKGRGRSGRYWFSPEKKGIYMSLILRPRLLSADIPKITLMTAVVAAESISKLYDVDIRIKWPNDILVNEKKIAGILTTMNRDYNAERFIVVGIGINVNTEYNEFPDEIRSIATSLFIETDIAAGRTALVQSILELFEYYYGLFQSSDFGPIMSKWKELSQIVGKNVQIDLINNSITGEVIDIDSKGFLLVKNSAGKL